MKVTKLYFIMGITTFPFILRQVLGPVTFDKGGGNPDSGPSKKKRKKKKKKKSGNGQA